MVTKNTQLGDSAFPEEGHEARKLAVHRGIADRNKSGGQVGRPLREIEIGCRVPADSEARPRASATFLDREASYG